LQAENERLRAGLARMTEQRDILKKAAGILSEPSPSGMPDQSDERRTPHQEPLRGALARAAVITHDCGRPTRPACGATSD